MLDISLFARARDACSGSGNDNNADDDCPSRRVPTSGVRLCRAVNCGVDVSLMGPYCRKKRLCMSCIKTGSLMLPGSCTPLRFCQQCGKLEPISCFSSKRRSCKMSLKRRRGPSAQDDQPVGPLRTNTAIATNTSASTTTIISTRSRMCSEPNVPLSLALAPSPAFVSTASRDHVSSPALVPCSPFTASVHLSLDELELPLPVCDSVAPLSVRSSSMSTADATAILAEAWCAGSCRDVESEMLEVSTERELWHALSLQSDGHCAKTTPPHADIDLAPQGGTTPCGTNTPWPPQELSEDDIERVIEQELRAAGIVFAANAPVPPPAPEASFASRLVSLQMQLMQLQHVAASYVELHGALLARGGH